MSNTQETVCQEFEALEREQQMAHLQNDGVYVGKRKTDALVFLLYQYKTIYVEVAYRVYRTEVEGVSCFVSTDVLDQYL